MSIETHKHLITSYVAGMLTVKDSSFVESLIGSSEELQEFYLQKCEKRDFLKSLIPEMKMSIDSKRALERTIREINKEVFPKEKFPKAKKLYDFLTNPIIEI